MFNPCYEHCYLKYGKSYDEKCDTTCEYAKVAAENKKLTAKLGKIYDFVKDNENKWYSEYTGTDYTEDYLGAIRAAQYLVIRHFVEQLGIEEIKNDD